MENKVIPLNEQSFLPLASDRDKAERMNRLFAQAAGGEDPSRRSANVKVFDLGAGRTQEVIFPEPVHFREGGEWKDIDNTLVETTDALGRAVLQNRANPVRVSFPKAVDGGSLASISNGSHTFSWRFEQEAAPVKAAFRSGAEIKNARLADKAAAMPKFVGLTRASLLAKDLSAELESPQQRRGDLVRLRSENAYDEILPGVSVRYTLNGQSLKEDIIVASPDALARTALRLPKDFTYELTEYGSLLVKKEDTVLFTLNTPFVFDADGNQTIAASALSDCGDYVRLAYVIDPEFLAGASFPITIDPLVNTQDPVHNIQDTTLTEGSSAKPYTAPYLYVGKSSGKRNVAVIKFNTIPIPQAKDAVVSAQLAMVCTATSGSTNYISVHEILKNWESNAVNWSIAKPYNAANVCDDAIDCVAVTANSWVTFDVTNLYRKWCTKNGGVAQNFGVALRSPANITANNYTTLVSSDGTTSYRPVLYVNYVSHAGIEGWWHYETMNAGRAGTVYADIFNGNMVLSHSDTVMTGNRNPVSITHAYNSALSGSNSYGCGYGWKTSANQKVTQVTWSDRQYYAWEDGDGTQHYFHITGSEPYKDEEGMDLKLTTSTNYLIITDKQNNRLRFKKQTDKLFWLNKTADSLDTNVTTYYYVNDDITTGRIDHVVDPVGRVTQFTYSNNLLASISIPDTSASTSRCVYFTYDSSSRLTGVRYSELGGSANHTTYGYDGTTNILTRARNYDGVQVNIAYEAASLYNSDIATNEVTNQMRRVLSLETVVTNSSGTVTKRGAKETFAYKHMCTEVTAVENTSSDAGKKLFYQFNDSGNVVCVRDELGYGSFTKFASSIENTPSEQSRLRRVVVNLLRSPDLSANWTTSGTVVKDTSARCLNVPSEKITANSSEGYARQEVTLAANTTYTFSAYVKTSGVAGTGAFLRLRKKSSASSAVTSVPLTGTTLAAVNNGMAADGWERVRVTINHNASASEAYYADMVLAATSGTAWFAAPQLETGPLANNFNIVSNGDFRYTYTSGSQTLPSDWTSGTNNGTTATTGVFAGSTDPDFPEALSGNYLAIEGFPDMGSVGFIQSLDIAGQKGDVYTIGGWANSHSVPHASTPYRFSLLLRIQKTDGSWSPYARFNFNEEWTGWQFASFAAVAGYDYQKVQLYVAYINNCNVSQFSNIFFHREAFGASFAYDDDKNLIAVTNLAEQKSNIEYDAADNIKKYTQPGRDSSDEDNKYWFDYGPNLTEKQKHLMVGSRTPMHLLDYYGYDSYGNRTSSRRINYSVYTDGAAEDANPYIRMENTYTADGNYGATAKDARGNIVTSVVNTSDGTLTSVRDPENQTVNYTYDAAKRVTGVQTTGNDKTYKNAYTYENDRIKTVSHNTTSDTVTDVTYTFNYDSLGRKTTVQVGSQTLSTNVYANDRNGLLSEVDFGNGGKVKYAYDEYDRLTGVKYDAETANRYSYEYDATGKAAEVTDANLGRVLRTGYDLADRPCQTELRKVSDGSLVYGTLLQYDKLNNLQKFTERVGSSETHSTAYTYDRDNRVTQISYDGTTNKVGYAFDALGRMTSRTVEKGVTNAKLASAYSYVDGGYGNNSSSGLVSAITQSTPAGAAMNFAYDYDTRGNIISETRNGVMTSYAYDALGQLIRVNDPNDTTSGSTGTTWVYNYDRGGNITGKRAYAYTTGSLTDVQWRKNIAYTYWTGLTEEQEGLWKDVLVKCTETDYDATGAVVEGPTVISFQYDGIGNTTTDGMWTYEWEAGRKLKRMVKADNSMTVEYAYDHNGLRTQKKVTQDGVVTTTEYTLYGKLLMHMKQGSNELHFFYDANSRPAMVKYYDVMYTYVHNLQGDIVAILDKDGVKVVEYKYDAWGRLLDVGGSMASSLGELNPFRYREYVYDQETRLYYLGTRYYNSYYSRFIQADNILDDATKNCFTYTNNWVTKYYDKEGKKTYAVGTSRNAIVAFLSYGITSGYCWDDEGNIAQFTTYYGLNGMDITNSEDFFPASVGIIDVGIYRSWQITDRNTVFDLKGEGSAASIFFIDTLSDKRVNALGENIIGFQVNYPMINNDFLNWVKLSNQYTVINANPDHIPLEIQILTSFLPKFREKRYQKMKSEYLARRNHGGSFGVKPPTVCAE